MVEETAGKEGHRVLNVHVTETLHARFRMLAHRKGYNKPTEFMRALMMRELDVNESREGLNAQ